LQLQYGQDDDMKEKVENVAILSMSDKEIADALKIVSVSCLLSRLFLVAQFLICDRVKGLLSVRLCVTCWYLFITHVRYSASM